MDERLKIAYPNKLAEQEELLLKNRRKITGEPADTMGGNPLKPEHDDASKAKHKPLMQDTLGIALSGGGIRSATFSLGVFQSLARHNFLKKIDYLSTVSGGGYFGSFLGAWISRGNDSIPDIQNKIQNKMIEGTPSEELRWLRENGRYVSPNGAGDALYNIASYLRNWVSLNIVMVLFISMVLSLLLIFQLLISEAIVVFKPFLMHLQINDEALNFLRFWFLRGQRVSYFWLSAWSCVPVILLVGWAVPCGWAYWLTQREDKLRTARPGPRTTFNLQISSVFAILIVSVLLEFCLPAVSAIAVNFFWFLAICAGMTIIIWGLVMRKALHFKDVTQVEAQARKMLADNLKWAFLAVVVTLGIAILDTLGRTLYFNVHKYGPEGFIKLVCGSLGITSFAALVSAFTRIPQFLSQISKNRILPLPTNLIVTGISFTVLLVILATLSAGVHGIAWGLSNNKAKPAPLQPSQTNLFSVSVIGVESNSTNAVGIFSAAFSKGDVADGQTNWPGMESLEKSHDKKPLDGLKWPLLRIAVAFLTFLFLSLAASMAMTFLNLSSLQQVYTSRLVRAYLGATNPERQENGHLVSFVSDLIQGDQIAMEDYRPHLKGGPLHLINVTLNETVDGKSQVEQRDRKGMGMAIGPCGLSVGVSHHGLWKGGETLDQPRDFSKVLPISSGTGFHLFVVKETKPLKSRLARAALFVAKKLMKRFAFSVDPSEEGVVKVESLPLGNWVAVSGAAFSTGLGAKTNIGLSVALGMSNIRLGYWWNSGVDPMDRNGKKPSWLGSEVSRTFPVQSYLLDEFLARFHGSARKLWYLSDGGHFENTAAYELIRRRVPYIIICDNGCDPTYDFEDLANLIRKARIDFGAETTILKRRPQTEGHDSKTQNKPEKPDPWSNYLEEIVPNELLDVIGEPDDFKIQISPDSAKGSQDEAPVLHRSKKHALLARVKYPQSNGDANVSWLLIIKPSLTGDEPLDLIQYQVSSPSFPQESTTNQFFDEAQWESYRKLGEHIGDALFNLPKHKDHSIWSVAGMFRVKHDS